jgi:hypothetical protein
LPNGRPIATYASECSVLRKIDRNLRKAYLLISDAGCARPSSMIRFVQPVIVSRAIELLLNFPLLVKI